jgi:AraC-like DNA-binding protein
MINEAESAFVRAHFSSGSRYTEFRRGDPDLGALVRDTIRSLERQQYETAATLVDTLQAQSDNPGSNAETLVSLYNALVVQTRSYYSLNPATGLLPRPLNGVVELPFRYATIEDVFEALNSMLDYLRRTDTGENQADGNTMIHVREYIENHFSEDVSMDRLAETFDLEKNQLSQRFKHTHGAGISEFIRTTRIDHARFLLRTTTMPISTIGELCGYSDYYYFARVFKRETGVTCSQFREEETEQ